MGRNDDIDNGGISNDSITNCINNSYTSAANGSYMDEVYPGG